MVHVSPRAANFIFGADNPCGFLLGMKMASEDSGVEKFELPRAKRFEKIMQCAILTMDKGASLQTMFS